MSSLPMCLGWPWAIPPQRTGELFHHLGFQWQRACRQSFGIKQCSHHLWDRPIDAVLRGNSYPTSSRGSCSSMCSSILPVGSNSPGVCRTARSTPWRRNELLDTCVVESQRFRRCPGSRCCAVHLRSAFRRMLNSIRTCPKCLKPTCVRAAHAHHAVVEIHIALVQARARRGLPDISVANEVGVAAAAAAAASPWPANPLLCF